jgi:hypothetical protein
MSGPKLPQDRATHCAWTCFHVENGIGGHPYTCEHGDGWGCRMIPVETLAMRLEGRKGPDYSERRILPPVGLFREARK